VSKIISSDKVSEYKIEKFNFGKFSKKDTPSVQKGVSVFAKHTAKSDDPSTAEDKSDEKLQEYEELLRKIDTLTDEVVSLQMKLEEEDKKHAQELQKVKDEAYQQGIKDAQDSLSQEIEDLKVQYISSITSLQELELQIKEKLKTFEEELIETSIIIATKVIKKEVEEHSSEIAKSIARYLLSDIEDDVEVKLSVNPKDYEELIKENLKENIKIVADSAIKEGGVILLSKDKNLDGTIETRFKKTLQLIKES